MQLTERFEGQNMVASTFDILYPQRMSKSDEDQLKKGTELIRKQYPEDFSEDLDSELRSFVNELEVKFLGEIRL